MWEYDSLTGDTQHQAIQRIVNKRGVFTSALSGNSCSLTRAWASAVCRLLSAMVRKGYRVHQARADTVR